MWSAKRLRRDGRLVHYAKTAGISVPIQRHDSSVFFGCLAAGWLAGSFGNELKTHVKPRICKYFSTRCTRKSKGRLLNSEISFWPFEQHYKYKKSHKINHVVPSTWKSYICRTGREDDGKHCAALENLRMIGNKNTLPVLRRCVSRPGA
jgi:hypothetical protein